MPERDFFADFWALSRSLDSAISASASFILYLREFSLSFLAHRPNPAATICSFTLLDADFDLPSSAEGSYSATTTCPSASQNV
eukprot:CAMPEP_0197438192 /NCGR_PEP_ID=MMETSP1175-20131217/5259_1 /TAXON_ID=1003142 /ORGANISM="Triceratium dubium, Strain CCMP147" /LENGTH=82 /DNA_ID=CAMNT_0042967873 /DNA_START=52 /DNA_END=300 /DNA_ORIENTATION=+